MTWGVPIKRLISIRELVGTRDVMCLQVIAGVHKVECRQGGRWTILVGELTKVAHVYFFIVMPLADHVHWTQRVCMLALHIPRGVQHHVRVGDDSHDSLVHAVLLAKSVA